MLARAHRFHGNREIRGVLRSGKSTRLGPFQLKYLKAVKESNSKVAVIVSKKVSKSAVSRNRIRRRVYEVFRHQWGDLKEGYSIIITVYSDNVLKQSNENLDNEITKLIKKAKLSIEE